MSIDNFIINYTSLKLDEKTRLLGLINNELSAENIEVNISKNSLEKLLNIFVNLLDGCNPLLQTGVLRTIPLLFYHCKLYLNKTNIHAILLSIIHRLGDTKTNVRVSAMDCLLSLYAFLREFSLMGELINETMVTKNLTQKEYALKLFEQIFKINDISKDHQDKIMELASKLRYNSNLKIRECSVNILKLKDIESINQEVQSINICANDTGNITPFLPSITQVKPSILNRSNKDDAFRRRNCSIPHLSSSNNIETFQHSLKSPFTQDKLETVKSSNPKTTYTSIKSKASVTKQPISRIMTVTSIKHQAEIAITVEDLMKIWEERTIPKGDLLATSVVEFHSIREGLASPTTDWTKRTLLMNKLRGIIHKYSNTDRELLVKELNKFDVAFSTSVKDLRSKIHKEIFSTISFVAYKLGDGVSHLLDLLLPVILPIFTSSPLPSISSATSCIELMIKYCKSNKLHAVLLENIKSNRSYAIRRKCALFLQMSLVYWNVDFLEKKISVIEEILSVGLIDADGDVRNTCALVFWNYYEMFKLNAMKFYEKLENRTKNMIDDRKSISAAVDEVRDENPIPQRVVGLTEDNISTTNIQETEDEFVQEKAKINSLPSNTNKSPPIGICDSLGKNKTSYRRSHLSQFRSFRESPKKISPSDIPISIEDESICQTSPSKTICGPPGYTPFSTKHTTIKHNEEDIDLPDFDKIYDMINDVEFETILRNLASPNIVDIEKGIQNIVALLESKKKISISSITRLQDVFVYLLKCSDVSLMEEILPAIKLFISQYNSQNTSWISTITLQLLNILPKSSDPKMDERIFSCVRAIQGTLDENAFFEILMRFIAEIPLDFDSRSKIIISQYIGHFLKETGIFNNNHYFPSALSKIISWATDMKDVKLKNEALYLLRRIYNSNQNVFTTVSSSMPPLQHDTLSVVMQLFDTSIANSLNTVKREACDIKPQQPFKQIVSDENVTKRKQIQSEIDPSESTNRCLEILNSNIDQAEIVNALNILNKSLSGIFIPAELSLSLVSSIINLTKDEKKLFGNEIAIMNILEIIFTKSDSFPNKYLPLLVNLCIAGLSQNDNEESSRLIFGFVRFISSNFNLPLTISLFYQLLNSNSEKISILRILDYYITINEKMWVDSASLLISILPLILEIFIKENCELRKYSLSCLLSIYKYIGADLFMSHIQHIEPIKVIIFYNFVIDQKKLLF